MADDRPPKSIEEQLAEEFGKVFKHFAPGGKFGPIEDPAEWERMRESLPPDERDLNFALTQFLQLVDYFGRSKLRLNPDVADSMKAAAELPLPERAARIREINQELMKRLHHAGQGAAIRM